MEPDLGAALRDFEDALQELVAEVTLFHENVQAVTEYQSTVFQVTKHLCSWMENIEELSRHRKQLRITAASEK